MIMLKQIVLTGLVIIGIVITLMYLFQRHLIYFPNRHTPKLEDYNASDMKIVSLHTEDNLHLKSWYIPAGKHRPTILYLHGNAGHIGYRMPLAREFIDAGLGVFLLEYRGYGGNPGKPNEKGLYEDGEAAIEFLIQHGVPSKSVILYGESIGTGVATQLATKYPVCAVILQSPFTSLTRLAQYHYPLNFLKPWDQYNSLARMKKIHAPLLVLHGKLDQIVPYQEGLNVFNEANEPKKMLSFDDKEHNDLWSADNFSREIIQFALNQCS
ncbi:TPA: alpha/beta hydrolase [Legionella pneumophila]|nr:alpha/beta hydrolase [Legionella pneumophila]